jgi:hypothetical protein
MRAADIPVDVDGALALSRLLLRGTEAGVPAGPARTVGSNGKPGLLERLDAWLARGKQRELEQYLAESRDVFELEARIRARERLPYY